MRLTVNGADRDLPGDPRRALVWVLRDELGLTGTKPSCGEGVCGACTVLVDGAPTRSCVTTLEDVAGRSVVTVEGLAPPGSVNAVQRAMLTERAFQCGYCTPGMVVAGSALLAREPRPARDAVVEALDGHICRCGTYPRILLALESAGSDAAVSASDVDGIGSSSTATGPIDAGSIPWDRLEPEERGYFDALGDGLVVVLPPPLDDPAWAAAWTTPGGVWLHVGADGVVTAFTGKVEMGQAIAAALRSIVGDAVGVPSDAVRLVMADTDVTPTDEGTFGSRTIPDAGAMLRVAGWKARDTLVGLAAEALEASAADLVAGDGRIRSRDGARGVRIGDLVVGRRVIEMATGRPSAPSTAALAQAKRAPAAWDGDAPVTGRRAFVADLSLPGMLVGRQLQPPVGGARLRAVDTSEARATPGVTVVESGDIVAVAGPDLETVDRAIAAIRAEWAIPDGPGEAEVVAHLRGHPTEGDSWDPSVDEADGDVEVELARGDAVVEATYTSAYVAHAPLEGRAALAAWTGDRVTVWTSTQAPFWARAELAESLGVTEDQVRVIVPPMGGGFGGKHGVGPGIAAALLARESGRPVSCRWRQADEFVRGHVRPMTVIDVRAAARADGTITAWEVRTLNGGANAIRPPYRISSRRIVFQPAESPIAQDSYRALAATMNTFARESVIDELAASLGHDPLELRLANVDDERLAECLETAARHAGWPAGGLGIAGSIEKDARVATCAEVSVDDGRIRVERLVTAFDCGAVIDADNLRSQVEGATVMALGPALFEAVRLDRRGIVNGSLGAYRVPRFSDVPRIEVILLDRPAIPSAGGGEVPLIAVAPAIANAIFRAAGVRLRAMPLVPDGRVRPADQR